MLENFEKIKIKFMEKEEAEKMFNNICEDCDLEESIRVWGNQSEEFRKLWREKIMNDKYPELSEEEMDHVILFFCQKARGAGEFKRGGGHAAAFTNIRQLDWYKALRSLKKKKDIREKLNQIFTTEDENGRIILVNELENINKGNGNFLTGPQAIVLNAFLFAYNPDKYLMTFALSHRFAFMDFFMLGDPKRYKTYGEKVIKTNSDIISGFKEKYGVNASPIELNCLIYCDGGLSTNYNWGERINYWKE